MEEQLTDIEQRILKWDDPDDTSDTCDLIHRHFEDSAAKFSDWYDVSGEGRRLYGLMFKEQVEDSSPLDGLLAGIAAAAYCLAVSQVARQLGVDEHAVHCALETDRLGDADSFVAECRAWKPRNERTSP
jgi:hypothetical protein